MNRSLTLTLLLFLFLSLDPASAKDALGTKFPGINEFIDPTSRWSIEWKEATETKGHELRFKNLENGKVLHLLWFDRSVNFLWSPDGNSFAITDYAGSSESFIWVGQSHTPESLINLEQIFIKSQGQAKIIYENGHRYFEAIDWITPTVLRFSVKAHDAHKGEGYDGVFYYEIGKSVSKDWKTLK
jgi:hypothetical protein